MRLSSVDAGRQQHPVSHRSGDITNNGTLQGNSLVLSTGGVLTNNGQFTAGKGDSTFSAQRIVLNAAGSLSAGGDVVFNSLSDITVNGFTGTAGSLTMNAVGTLLNTALIYAANNMRSLPTVFITSTAIFWQGIACGCRKMRRVQRTVKW